MKKKQLNWHRIFGITLMDYFTRTEYDVELEVDLSLNTPPHSLLLPFPQ